MKNRFLGFGELLTQGIDSIQKIESQDKKKRISEIETELAKSTGRQVSTIQWFRKGHIPKRLVEIEELARVIFRRGQMSVEWLEQFLKSAGHPNWTALRDELAPTRLSLENQNNASLYKRLKMSLNKQLSLDGSTQTIHDVEILVTSQNPLSIIRHRTINSTNVIQDYRFELNETNRDDKGKITARIISKNENIYSSVIEFTPPLTQGNHAYYSYTARSKGSLSLTFDEVHRQYLEGQRRADYESWGFTIKIPTEQLNMHILFPPKYPISLPTTGGFGVYQELNDVLEEKTRVIAGGGFSAKLDKDLEQWSLKLSVLDAKMGCYYELQWIPPPESILKSIVS